MRGTTLTARNLELCYPRGPLVLQLSELSVAPGEILAMIGPNGGGKTTLLRTMSGLMPPHRGQVLLGELPLYGKGAISRRERARELAVVLTGTISPGYLRVEELVDLGRIPHHPPLSGKGKGAEGTEGDRIAVREAMDIVGINQLARRRVGSLSDGERQRALIARALAQEPRLMLLDEPGAHLDPPHQTQLFMLLKRLVSEGVIASALVATHNIHLALHFATRLCIVAKGAVVAGDPCELLDNGAVDRAFLPTTPGQGVSPVTGAGGGALPEVRLDREKGWFVPRE
jgi:iron complex transport system ATP-binding protein